VISFTCFIGIMQAFNRGHVREFSPSRKDPHWGRDHVGAREPATLRQFIIDIARDRAGVANFATGGGDFV
jgi:hypothetical protein